MAKHFDELPPETKKFIEDLTPEKIKTIEEGIKTTEAIKTIGKFWKWTILIAVGLFTTMATVGQSIDWLWRWMKGGA